MLRSTGLYDYIELGTNYMYKNEAESSQKWNQLGFDNGFDSTTSKSSLIVVSLESNDFDKNAEKTS